MNFDRVLRGYNPKQVDSYVSEMENKHKNLCASQKQRIDELADENWSLRKQVEKYKANEDAISQTLVESQKLAEQTKNNAEKFSELTLLRAKIFYAAWYAYSKTMVASLSDEEVRQFNALKQKVESLINAYEGGNVAKEAAAVTAQLGKDDFSAKNLANPIEKVQEAAHVIELDELVHPTQSLEDLCKDLGLKSNLQK